MEGITDRKAGEATEFAKIKETVRAFYSEEMRQRVLEDQRKTASRSITIDLP